MKVVTNETTGSHVVPRGAPGGRWSSGPSQSGRFHTSGGSNFGTGSAPFCSSRYRTLARSSSDKEIHSLTSRGR